MLEIKSFTFNDYQENTYIVSENGKCIIIDPGNYQTYENKEIKGFFECCIYITQYQNIGVFDNFLYILHNKKQINTLLIIINVFNKRRNNE